MFWTRCLLASGVVFGAIAAAVADDVERSILGATDYVQPVGDRDAKISGATVRSIETSSAGPGECAGNCSAQASSECVGFNFNVLNGTCELLGYAREFELAEGGPDENVEDGWRYYLRRQPRNDSSASPAIPMLASRPLAGQVQLLPGVYRDAFVHNVEYLRGWVNKSDDGIAGTDNLLYWFRERAGKGQVPGAVPVGWDCGLRGSVAGGVMMGIGNSLQWESSSSLSPSLNSSGALTQADGGLQDLRAALEGLVGGIGAAQSTGGSAGGASLAGYAMAFEPNDTISHENPDYVTSWVIHGLLAADRAGVKGALQVARAHMSWFNNATYLPLFLPPDGGPSPARFPEGYNPGKSTGKLPLFGHLIYLIYQGIIHNTQMALSDLGTQADVDLVASLYEEPWWLEELARGNTTAVWARVPWPHNYEGTAINAYLDMYRLTGDPKYVNAAKGWRSALRQHWIDHSGVIQLNELIFYPPGSYLLDFDGFDPKQPNATTAAFATVSDAPAVTGQQSYTEAAGGAAPRVDWALDPQDLRLARAYGPDWNKPPEEGGMPGLQGVRPACKGPTRRRLGEHSEEAAAAHRHSHDHHDHRHDEHVLSAPREQVLESLRGGSYESEHAKRLRSAVGQPGSTIDSSTAGTQTVTIDEQGSASAAVQGAYHGHPIGEFCGHSFWIRVNQKMRALTGEIEDESYAFEIERSLTNVVLAQDAGGTRGIRHFTSLHKRKMPPRYVGDCCEGQGTRTFGSLPEYVFFLSGSESGSGGRDGVTSASTEVHVDLYFPSLLSLPSGFKARVGGAYPWGGNVTVTAWASGEGESGVMSEDRGSAKDVSAGAVGSVAVRVPLWAQYGAAGGVPVLVDGKEYATGKPGSYVHVQKPDARAGWRSGSDSGSSSHESAAAASGVTISMSLPWELHAFEYTGSTVVPGHSRWSVHQGPVALAFVTPDGSGWSNATDTVLIRGISDPGSPAEYLTPAPELAPSLDIPADEIPEGGSPMVYRVKGNPGVLAMPYHAIKQDLLLMDVYPAFEPVGVDRTAGGRGA